MASPKILSIFVLSVVACLVFLIPGVVFAKPTFNGYMPSQTNVTVQYSPSINYGFEINITNITGSTESYDIESATWQFAKPSGAYYNYTTNNISLWTTFTNNTGGVWWINFTQSQLGPAGNYNITIYANNTVDDWNSSSTYVFVISVNDSTQDFMNLTLNGTETDKTYTYNTATNATGWNDTSVFNGQGSVTFTLYRNTALIGTGTVSDVSVLSVGLYNYTYNTSGNSNYTSAQKEIILTISGLGNGASCSANNQCAGGYCVHNICRSAANYCGDGYCDLGEWCSCLGDCGGCYLSPAAQPSPEVSTTLGKAIIYIPSIAADSRAKVTIERTEGIDFTEITITVKNKVNYVYVTIRRLDAKPVGISEASGKVYHYIDVVKEGIEDDDISNVNIGFEVEKSWMSDNGVDEDTILLNRYVDNGWKVLITTKTGEDDDYVYYEAGSLGLSYFVITGGEGEGAVTTTTSSTTTTTTTSPTTTTTAISKLPEIEGRDEYSIVLIVLVVFASILFLRRDKLYKPRRRKRRR